jgi:hypothetical protein
VTRYVEERRDAFGVEPICRTLGVAVSTHYARRSRKPSRRACRPRLLSEIEAARVIPPRLRRPKGGSICRRRIDVGRDQVARAMQARHRRQLRGRTHRDDPDGLAERRDLL